VVPPNSGVGALGGEDEAVARIAARCAPTAGARPDGEIWIGDDAAYAGVAGSGGSAGARFLLATDVAVEGVHADLALMSQADLGWRAVVSTVSDIAAMGGRPTHLLVGLCVPRGARPDAVMEGAADAASQWGSPIVGGDLTIAREIVVSVTAIGILEDLPEPAGPCTRAGARPGDRLVVTGALGASAAGLRRLRAGVAGDGGDSGRTVHELVVAHRRPLARVAEGVAARAAGASAMIDVSDGLGRDLDRLARASGVGIVLDAVPVAPGATEEEAVGGGEDFELVIATSHPDRLTAAFSALDLRPPLVIGRCTALPQERSLRGSPLDVVGFRHDVV